MEISSKITYPDMQRNKTENPDFGKGVDISVRIEYSEIYKDKSKNYER